MTKKRAAATANHRNTNFAGQVSRLSLFALGLTISGLRNSRSSPPLLHPDGSLNVVRISASASLDRNYDRSCKDLRQHRRCRSQIVSVPAVCGRYLVNANVVDVPGARLRLTVDDPTLTLAEAYDLAWKEMNR